MYRKAAENTVLRYTFQIRYPAKPHINDKRPCLYLYPQHFLLKVEHQSLIRQLLYPHDPVEQT